MTDQEYLESVLRAQTLQPNSEEMRALQRHRSEVESLLEEHFANSSPTIRYGGSRAKGTMNLESYDLDITCYFERDNTDAGGTLQEIYENVENALATKYRIQRKPSAIRLLDCDAATDFHIDVVPGRFVDDECGDVFLYQSSGEKGRLKTNLDVHIAHVKDSGVIPAIRLLKLWAARYGVGVKTFALELLVVDLLRKKKAAALSEQLTIVLEQFRDNMEELSIEDPANRTGNDLSEMLSAIVRFSLTSTARRTLEQMAASGWEGVYGETEESKKAKKVAALGRMAATATVQSRPFGGG